MKVFLLYEHAITGPFQSYPTSTLVDIFTDWNKGESARVGMNTQKEHAFLEFELVEWDIRE